MQALLDKLVPPADKPAAGWHVSAAVDLAAYQFGWLWILIPLALAGDMHPKDYLGLWAFGMTLSWLHRHFTMPYVYLDRQVFSQHVTRFTLFAALLMLGFVGSAFLFHWKAPRGFFRPVDAVTAIAGLVLVVQCVSADKRGHRFSVPALSIVVMPFAAAVGLGLAGLFVPHHLTVVVALLGLIALASLLVAREVRASPAEDAQSNATLFSVIMVALALCGLCSTWWSNPALHAGRVKGSALVGAVGVFAAVWNVWHTLMQKFGIMRLYAAKSAAPVGRRTPAWVDRLLVFGSLPLLMLWIGPAQREVIRGQSKAVTAYLMPVIDGIEVVQPVLLPLAAALSLFSLLCFVWHERQADGLRSWPRLSMAVALTLLTASFFFLSPLKVYAAYGFSHALEYMVFVWAFLRRRYAHPLPHRPLIQRALARPLLSYGAFVLVLGLSFFLVTYGDDFGLHDGNVRFFGIKLWVWLFTFAIWHSMLHFYFDGFLWKMRTTTVRAHL